MTFSPQNLVLTKVFYQTGLIGCIHNDSMYVKFGGIRNTKTWSKSSHYDTFNSQRANTVMIGFGISWKNILKSTDERNV